MMHGKESRVLDATATVVRQKKKKQVQVVKCMHESH